MRDGLGGITGLCRLIRDHGQAIEADLAAAYSQPDNDIRNLARPGSGLTLRRLCTLILGLPPEASIWAIAKAEYERSLKPTADKLRERQAHYDRKKSERGDV